MGPLPTRADTGTSTPPPAPSPAEPGTGAAPDGLPAEGRPALIDVGSPDAPACTDGACLL
ncbi:hypothetical protein ACFO4E_10125 [Nocardiopsis mangrovi]|uniref:Uncharacterized protein n=1 Tax=Nocardiopsis mangrovi TaxID=1179818 RepID=A0ABV9DTX9_9ACTN